MMQGYDDCSAWPALAERIVRHADAAWWYGLPAELVEQARQSPLGRRMLAGRLASSAAPQLFGSMQSLTAAERRRYPWLFEPIPRLRDTVTDLGALALSPALRRAIDGDTVGRLRKALSPERYARIMAAPDPWRGEVPDKVCRSASSVLRRAHSAGELTRLVHGVGLREVRGFARDLHAGLQELLRLCFSPRVGIAGPGPWLPRAAVAACLCLDGGDRGTGE